MKNKKINKKLVLNKSTITDLNTRYMEKVHGGALTGLTCKLGCQSRGITCGRYCNTDGGTCAETECGTCYHTCPPTYCDTECGC